jgi:hypothetical protein
MLQVKGVLIRATFDSQSTFPAKTMFVTEWSAEDELLQSSSRHHGWAWKNRIHHSFSYFVTHVEQVTIESVVIYEKRNITQPLYIDFPKGKSALSSSQELLFPYGSNGKDAETIAIAPKSAAQT